MPSESRAWLARPLSWLGVDHDAFAIVAMNYGGLSLHNIFMYYYVKVFLDLYHTPEATFQFVQLAFIPWNSLNDLFFGFAMDISDSWIADRRRVIKYGGPLFALSFLMPWFRWPSGLIGIHFAVSLFFYDLMFSCVEVAMNALFADFTQDVVKRVKASQLGQTTSIFGLASVFIMNYCSRNLQDYRTFQFLAVILAILTFVGSYYTGTFSPKLNSGLETLKISSAESRTPKPTESVSALRKSWRYFCEVVRERNFLVLCYVDFFRLLAAAAQQNFLMIITERLLSKFFPAGSTNLNIFYGACTCGPFVAGYVLGKPLAQYGPYKLTLVFRLCSIAVGAVVAIFGWTEPLVLAPYIFFESVSIFALYQCINLMWVHVIDHDRDLHSRERPISGLVFSQKAFFTKPAQSIAPMVILSFLGHAPHGQPPPASPETMVRVVAGFWTLCAVAECMLLTAFTLRHHCVKETVLDVNAEKLVPLGT